MEFVVSILILVKVLHQNNALIIYIFIKHIGIYYFAQDYFINMKFSRICNNGKIAIIVGCSVLPQHLFHKIFDIASWHAVFHNHIGRYDIALH